MGASLTWPLRQACSHTNLPLDSYTKTYTLDQFSLLITNMASDFAGDQYFFMIFLFKDHGPAIHVFKTVWGY